MRKYLFKARVVLTPLTSHLSPVLEAEHGVEEGVEGAGHVVKDS